MATKSTEDGPTNASSERYSVFTQVEKWCIVAMVSYAAWFSTMSSFIYFPAIHSISDSLLVSVDKVNLTITSYMAVATVAPTLVGDATDILGRRPIYLITLSLYFVANLATALAQSYSTLLGLRILQALAISGLFSVAYGVITDVASPAERGSYVSAVSFAITIAPSLGPILGGCLSYAAGWTWIFWFLCIASALCLMLILMFLPETSRKVVGNGSMPPPKYMRLPWPGLMRHWEDHQAIVDRKRKLPNPFKSLKILVRPDNLIIILAGGLIYVACTCIFASLSVLFIDMYHLTEWEAGLIYLPFGIGGVVSTFFTGRLIDSAYCKARTARGLSTDKVMGDDLDTFPIEKARISILWIPMLLTVGSIIGFGWSLHFQLHLAIPLCLQFVAGVYMQLDFSIYNTLLVDKNHRSPAAAQASNNIMRCTLAAITIAFIQKLFDKWGIGWTFTFMGGLCGLAILLFAIDYYKGFSWRQRSLTVSTSS